VPEVLIVAVLVAAGVGAWWLLRDLRVLAVGADSPHGRSVAVVVPARDEEASLPHLLTSLRLLSPPVDEVVVVDDASTDATSSVARDAGATVLDPGEPPAGWTGKAWACQVGADATRADLLLFLDADTVLSPDALGGLLELHARRGGLVSVQPFHTPVRPYEQLSSYFNVVSLMASDAFRAGDHAPAPMAFGPCLLTTRAHVIGPVLLQVDISCALALAPGVALAEATAAIDDALARRFDPQTRPFGQALPMAELAAVIDATPGIDYVEDIIVWSIASPSGQDSSESPVGVRVGVRIGLIATPGEDTRFGGIASVGARRLVRDDVGEVEFLRLHPWELLQVRLAPGRVRELDAGMANPAEDRHGR
jgi:hypothetical protein